jgi:fibronectin type 3 domain-containing protein
MSVESFPLSRQQFVKLLTAPGVFAGGFLPFERAEWRGDRYSLGKAAGKTPKDLFDGVRLQAADPRNIDRSRERAVQHDLSSVVKSLERLRSHPELAGVVLSPEMIVGRDPAGVSRVRFGLANPANGAFRSEAAAAAECHSVIRRAVRSAGLSVASSSPCDTAAGLKGLQAWTDGIRLRPSRTAAALGWARTAAAVASVGFVLWTIPPVARGIQGAFASIWNGCVAVYDHLFPKLDEPWSVEASDGGFTDRVRVTWHAVPKATGYALYRDDMRVPLKTVDGGDSTSFDDVSAEIGKETKYAVRATTMFTYGKLSDADSGYRNIEAPMGVVASRGTVRDAVEVDWQPVDGAEQYIVLRDGATSRSDQATTTNDEWRDTSAPVGVECRYRVCAKRGIATSQPSEPVAIGYRPTRVPTGLIASDGTSTEGVEINWNEVDGASEYRLSRSSPDTPNEAAEQMECSSPSYVDRSAEPGRSYVYHVTAVSQMGTETAASNRDDGWRGFVKPDVKASRGEFTDRVHVEWTPVSGAGGYVILRDGAAAPLGNVTRSAATSFDDLTAAAGKRHSYIVQPVVPRGEPPASDPDTGWRAIGPPARPVASRGFTDRVIVEWEPVAGAERYDVFRDGTPVGKVAGGAKTEYVDQAAAIGRLYRYTLTSATEETGPGPTSKAAEGYRNLEKPKNVQVRREGDTLLVTWQQVTGATRYEILRSDNQKGPQGFADGPTWQDDQPSDGPVAYRIRGRTDTVTGPESEPASLP